MNNSRYLILMLVVATFAVAAAAACEKGTPVDPVQEPAVAGVVPMASAAADDAGEPLYACYSARGNVYRIRESGLADDCRSPMDVEFSWNEQGPPGPPGPQGPAGGISGWQMVEAYQPTNSTYLVVSADCPAGKVLLGGGFNLVSYQIGMDPNDFRVLKNLPDSGTRWTVRATFGTSGLRWTLQVRAFCVDAP